MDDEGKRVTEYLVPANVTTRFEFFEGFGWYEFRIVLITLAIGTAIFFLLGIPSKTVRLTSGIFQGYGDGKLKRVSIIPPGARALFILIPVLGAYLVSKRDKTSNMSLLTIIKSSKEFKKKQKLYLYKYNSGREE